MKLKLYILDYDVAVEKQVRIINELLAAEKRLRDELKKSQRPSIEPIMDILADVGKNEDRIETGRRMFTNTVKPLMDALAAGGYGKPQPPPKSLWERFKEWWG
jgi:hypothetical protein